MKTTAARLAAAATTTAVALALSASPAWAHIGTSEDEVAAGSTTALGLTVPHGCEDSPTTAVSFQIPEGVTNASAFAHPGWTIASEQETLSPPITTAHGEEVTERVSVITFTATAGNALPHDVRDTFTINFTAPEDAVGETLWFKTIQSCEVGENPWIEEWDGEGEEPERLAPSVLVTEATEEGGHDEAATDTTEASDVTEVAAETTSSDSSSSDGLATMALVVGGLGLVTGGAALAKSRKTA